MQLNFCDELRNILIKEDLTQIEASEKTKMKPQQFNRYMSGKHIPMITTADEMLKKLGYELVIQEKGKKKK